MTEKVPKNLIQGAENAGTFNDTPVDPKDFKKNFSEIRPESRPLFDPDPYRGKNPDSFSQHPLAPQDPFGNMPDSKPLSEEEKSAFYKEQNKRVGAFHKSRLN